MKIEIKDLRNEINDYLKSYFEEKGTYNKLIYDAASYSLNIGGKRIRPILLLIGYLLYKKEWKKVIPMAAAIEMIHTYSLVHDDLPCMDNDDLRRGMPTNHKKYGENMAVLSGDTLLNEAMSLMISYTINNDNKALKVVKEIIDASGPEGMIGGQVVDILSEGKKISEEELYYMHNKKTGELIRVSILAGAMLADAPEKDLDILSQYGYYLGLAFQIKDDILDIIGTTEKLGKKVFSDEDNNKTNFITLYGLELCNKKCSELTKECLKLLDNLSTNADMLVTLTNELLVREN